MVKNNFKKHIFNFGFTLIEIIVVVGLLLTVVTLSVNLVNSLIKGSAKSEIIKEARQNGSYAMSVMDRMIRNASTISTCDSGMSSIELTSPDSSKTTFSFSQTNIASSGANLISDGYTVSSYGFDCLKTEEFPALVTIKFTLEKGNILLRSEEKVKIPFQTTVNLRGY